MKSRAISVCFYGFLMASTTWAAPVVITADFSTLSGEPLTVEPALVRLQLDPVGGAHPPAGGPVVHTFETPGQQRLTLPPDSTWWVSATGAGWWAPSRILYVEASGSVLSLRFFPAGKVTGRLKVDPDEEPPAEIDLRLTPVPDQKAHFETTTVSCPVEEGVWGCTVPVGTFDLRLRRAGFLSHYFWHRGFEQGTIVNLGVQSLERGASVVGWVRADGGGPHCDLQKARVELAIHGIGLGRGDEDRRQREDMGLATSPNGRGFFQLTGVAPGSYRLRATAPGRADTILAPIRVLPGAETEIQEVMLEPPVTLEVHLRSPQTPFRKPWQLHLARRSPVPGHREPVAEGRSSDMGIWLATGLAPGTYNLSVRDHRGSRWWEGEVDVEAGMPPLAIEIPFERLEGTLLLGEEPVEGAWLWFGGKHNARRIQVRSKEEGKFYVFLPRGERWRVDVEAVALNLQARLENVEVPERESGEPWPKTVLRLPDTGIFGTLLDTAGEPIAQGTVYATPTQAEGSRVSIPADASGNFLLRGLHPGSWRIDALANDAVGELRGILPPQEVTDGERIGPVEVVLRRSATLTGVVLSPEGRGVPGAQVEGLLERSAFAFPLSTSTDVNGVFELSVPPSVERVQLNVLPLGYAVTQVILPVSKDPVTVPVEPVGGTLEIHYSGDATRPAGGRWLRTTLFRDGVPVAHPLALQRWSEAHGVPRNLGDLYRIPMLAPGHYTACLDAPGIYQMGLPPEDARCASGYLPPFGELVLAVEGAPPG